MDLRAVIHAPGWDPDTECRAYKLECYDLESDDSFPIGQVRFSAAMNTTCVGLIETAEQHRRQGVGRFMLESTVQYMASQGSDVYGAGDLLATFASPAGQALFVDTLGFKGLHVSPHALPLPWEVAQFANDFLPRRTKHWFSKLAPWERQNNSYLLSVTPELRQQYLNEFPAAHVVESTLEEVRRKL